MLILVVGLAVSCGREPTAPVGMVGQPASAVAKGAVQSDGLIGSVVGDLVNLVFKVLDLVGSIGGSLSNGRWRVDIPPNAVAGNGTVSLGVSSSTSPSCQLGISPSSLNQFSKPVTLTASCAGVSSQDLQNYVIFWYNPGTGTWVPVDGSKVDLTAKTVSAPLLHFSTYSVGPRDSKASW